MKRKLILTVLVMTSSVFFYVASAYKIPVLDASSDQYFSESIKKATLAYATVRGVNAVVSVLKESEIEISPAGVGVNIAAGQILDPIDDMTERLSSVIVLAITSIGIQKITYEVGEVLSFKVIAIILLLLLIPIWLTRLNVKTIVPFVIKATAFIFILRLLLPVSALINEAIYENYLQGKIEQSRETLSVVSSSYEDLSGLDKPEEKGFFSTITGGAQSKIEKTRKAFLQVIGNVEKITASLLQLTTLYFFAFMIQVLLVPLGLFWLIYKLISWLFSSEVPLDQ